MEASNLPNTITDPDSNRTEVELSPEHGIAGSGLEDQFPSIEQPPKLPVTCGSWDTKQGSYFFLVLGVVAEVLNHYNQFAVEPKTLNFAAHILFIFYVAAHVLGLLGVRNSNSGQLIAYIFILYVELIQGIVFFFLDMLYTSIYSYRLGILLDNYDNKTVEEKHALIEKLMADTYDPTIEE